MNKPIQPPVPDDDVGPLDEHGQQIWSPEEEAAIARLHDDPVYQAAIDEALASADRGEFLTDEEMRAHAAGRRARWLAAHAPGRQASMGR